VGSVVEDDCVQGGGEGASEFISVGMMC